jgi:hypothetical protein
MKLFFSWSGAKSHNAALAVSEWIPCVLQQITPWVSSKDIDRGSIWFTEIYTQLSTSHMGLVFVTKDNQSNPWLLFEAGALSKGLTDNRVCTFLVDLSVRDILANSPLSHLNHTQSTKEQIFELIKTINSALGEHAVKEQPLEKTFSALWPDLQARLNEVVDDDDESDEPTRPDSEVLNDILENVLTINRRISTTRRHAEWIAEPQARKLFDSLKDIGCSRTEMHDLLSELTPTHWLRRKLDVLFGPEPKPEDEEG